jgi:ABC-2 type transport system permease protein
MNNTLLVIKHEIRTTLQKPSFWIITFIFPAFVLFLTLGSQVVGERVLEEAEAEASSIEQNSNGPAVGLIDHAGVIKDIPEEFPTDYFKVFTDVSDASEAIEKGLITQYYIVPEDFLASGEFTLVDIQYQPLRSSSNAEIFEYLVRYNLIERDPLGIVLSNPTPIINDHPLSSSSDPDQDDALTGIIPYATLMIFFFVITSSSSMMLTSVSKEKENRTAEILLLSLRPKELMTGKVIGLGFVALLQMIIWMSGGIFTLGRSNEFLGTAQAFALPPGFIIWAILFFILGYFLYASFLSAIGVLAPSAREGGQFTFLAIFPLMIPLWFNISFVEAPDGLVATLLSIFPLTSPPSMITRLAVGNVPAWQLVISLIALVGTTYLVIQWTSRLFRADTMLSLDSLNFKRLVSEFRKK